MKRILAVALLAASSFACADPVVVGVSASTAGGRLWLMSNVEQCDSGFGVLAEIPFNGPHRGCVTSFTPDYTSFHVVYDNGSELDYTTRSFTNIPKKQTQGAL